VQGLGGAVVSAVAFSLIMFLFTEPAERAKATRVYSGIRDGRRGASACCSAVALRNMISEKGDRGDDRAAQPLHRPRGSSRCGEFARPQASEATVKSAIPRGTTAGGRTGLRACRREGGTRRTSAGTRSRPGE